MSSNTKPQAVPLPESVFLLTDADGYLACSTRTSGHKYIRADLHEARLAEIARLLEKVRETMDKSLNFDCVKRLNDHITWDAINLLDELLKGLK